MSGRNAATPAKDAPIAGVRACVFDAYGTLFDVNSAVERERDALGARADALAELWRRKQLEYSWLRSMMGAYAPFSQITAEALDHALAATGLGPGAKDRLMALYMRLDAYPEVPDVLGRLRRAGLATAILSNGSPDMLDAAVASAGLDAHLDAVLSADAVGVFKPDARVYRLALDRLGLRAAKDVLFLSSNGWDVHGAAHFGFRVAWINRAGLVDERLPGAPLAVLDGLASLPDLVVR